MDPPLPAGTMCPEFMNTHYNRNDANETVLTNQTK